LIQARHRRYDHPATNPRHRDGMPGRPFLTPSPLIACQINLNRVSPRTMETLSTG
jgi:hypothetical protein